MRVLALETATEALSVAIWCDHAVAWRRREVAPRRHAAELLSWIDEGLAACGLVHADLTGYVVGVGPGSFTGVRIGVAAAQGLALARDLPVVGISSLESAAADVAGADEHAILAAFDARMGQIYCGLYDATGPCGEEMVIDPDQLAAPDRPVIGAGSGFATYHEVLAQRLGGLLLETYPDALPDAAASARIAVRDLDSGRASWADPAQLEPCYVRNRVAWARGSD